MQQDRRIRTSNWSTWSIPSRYWCDTPRNVFIWACERLFGMTAEALAQMPKWKRNNLKKKGGLFWQCLLYFKLIKNLHGVFWFVIKKKKIICLFCGLYGASNAEEASKSCLRCCCSLISRMLYEDCFFLYFASRIGSTKVQCTEYGTLAISKGEKIELLLLLPRRNRSSRIPLSSGAALLHCTKKYSGVRLYVFRQKIFVFVAQKCQDYGATLLVSGTVCRCRLWNRSCRLRSNSSS